MTLATKITLVRVLMIPAYMVTMYLSGGEAGLWMWLSLAIFIIASLTDYVDGQIARKCNQVSDFGKFLDPLADKVTQFTLFVCLALRHPILWSVSILFFVKELFQLIAGILAANRGYILKGALITGKVCTTVLFTTLVIMVVFPNISDIAVSIIALIDAGFLLIAFADYFRTYAGKSSQFQPLDDPPSSSI